MSSSKHTKRTYANPFLIFPKIEEKRTCPKLFYEATIALIPKLDKNKKYIQVSLMNNTHKFFSKLLTNKTQKGSYAMNKLDSSHSHKDESTNN